MIGNNRLKIFGRRRFLEVAAGALVTTQLMPVQAANAGLVLDEPIRLAESEGTGSFTSLKQIDAGVLDVGYVEAGPIDGPAVILLHGWPYDIHSFGEVTPRLASAGFHVIVPYVRGYGSTRFLSKETSRTGQPSALAVDTIALMDAPNIKKATIAGFASKRERCRCLQRPSCSGGTNTILRRSVAARGIRNTGGSSPN
jgi:hypothetical protein